MKAKTPYIPRVRPGVDLELQRDLRGAYQRINELIVELVKDLGELNTKAESYDFDRISRALSSGGEAALNVQGLLGTLAQPQPSGAPTVSALPGPDDPLSQQGSLVVFNNAIYVYDETTNTWNSGTGSVTSVDGASAASGFDITGGPITAAGTLTFTLTSASNARGSLGLATGINNFTAIVAPAVGNDNTQGYSVGSTWIDVALGDVYMAVDVSTGAAVWRKLN